MTTVVEVCNSALIKLGAEPINDLNDDTKEARLCRLQYERIKESVLRSAPWSFAVRRAELTEVATALEFNEGSELVYLLPADCVRVWKLNDGRPTEKYRIEGRNLLTALESPQIWYVTKDVSPNEYDANFAEALANTLAAEFSYSLTQSVNMKAGLMTIADTLTQQARSANSQEVTPEDFVFDDFLDSRRGGRAFYE